MSAIAERLITLFHQDYKNIAGMCVDSFTVEDGAGRQGPGTDVM